MPFDQFTILIADSICKKHISFAVEKANSLSFCVHFVYHSFAVRFSIPVSIAATGVFVCPDLLSLPEMKRIIR